MNAPECQDQPSMRAWLDRLETNKSKTASIPLYVKLKKKKKKKDQSEEKKSEKKVKKRNQKAKHSVHTQKHKNQSERIEEYLKNRNDVAEVECDEEDEHDQEYGASHTTKDLQSIRMWFTNPCGLGINYRSSKSYSSFKFLKDKSKADLIGLAETNVNWNLLNPTSSLYSRVKNHWKEFRTITSHNITEQMGKCQRGGTCSFAVGQLAHRFHSAGKDGRGLGRWTWIQFQGKDQHFTRVYTAYRPCKKPHNSKLTTVSDQHYRYIRRKKLYTDPRTLFDTDLHAALEKQIIEGTRVVVMLDANENVQEGQLHSCMQSLHLQNVFHRYCDQPMPPTHHAGSQPISSIFCSPSLLINRAGILQKGYGVQGDHRNMYVDFEITSFLGAPMFKVAAPKMKKLQLNDCRIYKRFIKEVKRHCKETNTISKAGEIFTMAQLHPDDPSLGQSMELLDDQLGRAIAHGLAKCRKLRTGNIPYSAALANLLKEKRLWMLVMKKKVGQRISHRTIRRLAKSRNVQNPMGLPLKEVKERLRQADVRYRRFVPSAHVERKHFYEELAAANATENKTTKEKMLKRIMNTEASRDQSRHMRRYFPTSAVMKKVDRVAYTKDGVNVEVNDPVSIVREIQRDTKLKYTSSHSTPLMHPAIHSMLGNFAETPVAKSILRGESSLEEVDYWTEKMIESVRTDDSIPKQKIMMTKEEIHDVWKVTKEHKASSISNRYNAVYKSLCKDPELLDLLTQTMNLPFMLGKPYKRWSKFLDIMSFKKSSSIHVNTLRTIIISEADWNASGKVYITRRMMRAAESQGLLPEEHFGGRKGKKATDGALTKRLLIDNSRMLAKPIAIISTDAANCYDRMLHKFIAMACMKWGVPGKVMKSLLEPLQTAQHFTRTAFGDSTASFSGTDLQGAGQGNTGAAPYWTCVSTHMIQLLKKELLHATYISPITKQKIILSLIAFVDDTELFISVPDDSIDTLVQKAERAINVWREVLQVTGGAMRPTKCAWTIMAYDDKARLLPIHKLAGDIHIPDEAGGKAIISKYDKSDSRKYLGVDQCTDGSEVPQYESLMKKVTGWNERMFRSKLSHQGNLRATLSKIYKSISYPLPVLTFTIQQCEKLGNKLFSATLPKCGITSKFPVLYRHLPRKYQGLGLPHLYLDQESRKLQELLLHSIDKSPCWKQLHLSLEIAQLETGTCDIVYNSPHQLASLLPNTWVRSQWIFLSKHGITIQGWRQKHPLQRRNDQPIMEAFQKAGVSIQTLRILNKCRMYLNVITVSDITDGYGESILNDSLVGYVIRDVESSKYSWKKVNKPTVREWEIWKQFLFSVFTVGSNSTTLRTTLGPWLQPNRDAYMWLYNPILDRLYKRLKRGIYRVYRPERNRQGVVTRVQKATYHLKAIQTLSASVIQSLDPARVSAVGSTINSVKFEGNNTATTYAPQCPREVSNLWDAALKFQLPQWYYIQCEAVLKDISKEVIMSMMSHSQLRIVADGSYENNTAASATIIETMDMSQRIIIPSPVPSNSNRILINDAYRAELHGLIVGLHTLQMMEQISSRKVQAIISCDNDRALEVCENYSYVTAKTKHSDIVQSIIYVKKKLESILSYEKVMGHADTKKKKQYKDLTRLEQLNFQCDLIAKHSRNTFRPATPTEMSYDGEHLSAWIDQEKIYSEVASQIKNYFIDNLAEVELCKKYSWRQEDFNRIAWNCVDKASTMLTCSTNQYISKHVTGFLPIGRNMVRRSHWRQDYCPRCKSDTETSSHLLQCNHADCLETFKKSTNTLDLWLIRQKTPDKLREEIIHFLGKWKTNQTCEQNSTLTSPMQVQLKFGWNHFVEGRPVEDFEIYMDNYYKTHAIRKTGKSWLASLIHKIWTVLHRPQWDNRNAHVHNHNEESEASRNTENLQNELQDLYTSEMKENLLVRDQHLMEQSMERLLEEPDAYMKAWIEEMKVAVWERDQIFSAEQKLESALMRGWMVKRKRNDTEDDSSESKRNKKCPVREE